MSHLTRALRSRIGSKANAVCRRPEVPRICDALTEMAA
jgi:hypothetical protein